MKHSVPHDLGQERAKKVAESALSTYANYNATVTWNNPNRAELSFRVKGMSISGTVEVLDRSIDLDIEVPFLLRPFKSQALGVIDGEINEWINKAKAEPV